MNRNSAPTNNGKLNTKQRSAVRTALATGATLVMVISAQMFASGNAVNSTSQSAAVATSVQAAVSTLNTDSDSESSVTANTSHTRTIFSSQSQPVPGTHSSR